MTHRITRKFQNVAIKKWSWTKAGIAVVGFAGRRFLRNRTLSRLMRRNGVAPIAGWNTRASANVTTVQRIAHTANRGKIARRASTYLT
jgi:hypothetical protein